VLLGTPIANIQDDKHRRVTGEDDYQAPTSKIETSGGHPGPHPGNWL